MEREFKLKEGQTYEDLYELGKKRLIGLFKKMLDYRKVSYKEDDSFDLFIALLMKVYPFYFDTLVYLNNRLWDPGASYIEVLNSMEGIYEMFNKDYMNYEKNFEEYEKTNGTSSKHS